MNAEGPTPPGWYPDSEGSLRWYDGTAWTEHAQPPGPPPSQPPPPGGGGAPRRGPLIAIIVAAVLLVAGAATALVLVLGSDDDGDDDPEADPGSSESTEASEPTEPTLPTLPTLPTVPDPSESLVPGPPGPEESPEAVVRTFIDATLARNCPLAEELVTEGLLEREGGCDPEDLGGSELEGVTFEVGAADIQGESATVPVTVEAEGVDLGPESTIEMALVQEDRGWRIDEFEE